MPVGTELCPRHLIGHELPPHLIVRSVNYNHFGKPSTLLSALTCSECAICEMVVPGRYLADEAQPDALKVQLRAGRRALRRTAASEADPMAEHRLVPTSRLITKLGIDEYNRKAPLDETPYQPARSNVAAAPARRCTIGAVRAAGDVVTAGQLIAEIAPERAGRPHTRQHQRYSRERQRLGDHAGG